MADQGNEKGVQDEVKKNKEEPAKAQEFVNETPVSPVSHHNSGGKVALFISLIALALVSYSLLSPPKIDLSKIDKIDKKISMEIGNISKEISKIDKISEEVSNIDKISSKTIKKYEEMQDEIDKLSASVHSEQEVVKENLEAVTNSVFQAQKIMRKMNSAIVQNENNLENIIADVGKKFENTIADVGKKFENTMAAVDEKFENTIAAVDEKLEQQKKQVNLGAGFANLITEIQPSLSIYCKRVNTAYIKLVETAKSVDNSVAVSCNFSNSGVLKANIVPGSIVLIGGKGQTAIANAVERIDNGEEATILPGRSHEKQYHIVLTDNGASNMKGGVMKMSFQSYTDKAALGIIKRKTSQEITERQLRELTQKSHIFSFLL
tara:strand:+ start:10025 stop:11158 length:1134 start_codon:yes stop_codon:yes gene_type:complete